jgi:hypothetical protein
MPPMPRGYARTKGTIPEREETSVVTSNLEEGCGNIKFEELAGIAVAMEYDLLFSPTTPSSSREGFS